MTEADLKFDEQIVCTKLAEEYLKSRTESNSLGDLHDSKEQVEIDQLNNTIFYVPCSLQDSCTYEDVCDISTKLLALVQKIEENVQLFCQLEFLFRKIPINDTKDVDLKLITQSLIYKGSFLDADVLTTKYLTVYIAKDTPLFHLGLVAYNTIELTIRCSKETVAVCTLFVELCRDVGLKHVRLAVYSIERCELCTGTERSPFSPISLVVCVCCALINQALVFFEPNKFDEQLVGCVGVVTARCDVDSAVDDLLAATTRHSWKLSGVLVQEAALERFTRALEWQTRGAAAGAAPFVLEPAGDARGVRVEAFRSVREALSLLETRAPLAVAAWASDLAEANEIAFGARAPLVWLNGHGHFRGPPAAAAAVYFRIGERYDRFFREASELLQISNMQIRKYTTWRELAPATRLERIREVLEKFHARSPLRISAVGLPAQSSVDVDRGVCIVTRTPVKWAIITKDCIEQSFTRLFDYLLAGGALTVVDPGNDVKLLCDLLSEIDVPVGIFDTTDRSRPLKQLNLFHKLDLFNTLYTIKVVWISM